MKAITAFQRRNYLCQHLTDLERRKHRISRQISKAEDSLYRARRITEIWNDSDGKKIPVNVEDDEHMYGKYYKVIQIDPITGDRVKECEAYPSAHTSKNGIAKEWHLKFRVWGFTYSDRKEWIKMIGIKDFEKAKELVRDWIITEWKIKPLDINIGELVGRTM